MFDIRCIGCQRCSREAISMWYHDHQLRWDEVCLAKMWRGTGKTATFVIGALQRIDYSVSRCQALMLAPTREAQMHWYCRGCCRMYNMSWCAECINVWQFVSRVNTDSATAEKGIPECVKCLLQDVTSICFGYQGQSHSKHIWRHWAERRGLYGVVQRETCVNIRSWRIRSTKLPWPLETTWKSRRMSAPCLDGKAVKLIHLDGNHIHEITIKYH